MRRTRTFLVAVAAAALSFAAPTVAFADPGDPGEPQVVVWVDGYTNFGAPYDQMISGQGWKVGEAIDVYINDEYRATRIAEPNAEGSATPEDYVPTEPMVPGDVVKLVGETGTRTHTVTSLTVTKVNPGRDTVEGTAEPGTQVLVFAPGVFQVVTADQDGDWLADFSSTDDKGVGPIGPGTFGVAGQLDNDADPGDASVVGWSSPGNAPAQRGPQPAQ